MTRSDGDPDGSRVSSLHDPCSSALATALETITMLHHIPLINNKNHIINPSNGRKAKSGIYTIQHLLIDRGFFLIFR